ncbi:MAG: aminoacyl-tRNA hydrolase [Dehalococcoidia bacterium]|nr:aminoacyl-tRNA hydrolase [Dehalococcoidia bacterium]
MPPSVLIVGLGNPGEKYARSRHNIGFRCLDALAKANDAKFDHKSKYELATCVIADKQAMLMKPRTLMNNSGEAVAPIVKFFHIPIAGLVVVYDDMDLPLGKLRIREKGSAGGHNGIRSIIEHISSENFVRVRVGIGRPEAAGNNTIGHVLGDFTKDEEPAIKNAVENVRNVIEVMLKDGTNSAMNKFN